MSNKVSSQKQIRVIKFCYFWTVNNMNRKAIKYATIKNNANSNTFQKFK